MKWRNRDDYPKKSGMYITEVVIYENGLQFNPVSYNRFDAINKVWVNPSDCNVPGKLIKWLDESIKEDGEDYWKQRCEAAEEVNRYGHYEVTGTESDVFQEWWDKWQTLKQQTHG